MFHYKQGPLYLKASILLARYLYLETQQGSALGGFAEESVFISLGYYSKK